VTTVLEYFRRDGLLRGDWEPQGDTDEEKIASARAKATVAWIRLHRAGEELEPNGEQVALMVRDAAIVRSCGNMPRTADFVPATSRVDRVIEKWIEASKRYNQECKRCKGLYDQTVWYDGRSVCLWCYRSLSNHPIPPFKPFPGAWQPGQPLTAGQEEPDPSAIDSDMGDAWEGPEPDEDGDIPPTPEV
jgi:hypothetical protein